MGIDFATLKDNNDIVDVIGRYVSLTKRGTEYYGNCPFHDDNKASLQVNQRKQIFKCFPCGAGGDVFDFLNKYGKTIPEAVAILQGDHSIYPGEAEKRTAKKSKRIVWRPIIPQLPASDFTHYRHGQPSRTWTYHAADGTPISYVCRFDTPDGKEVLPYSYCTDGERYEWRWQGLERPRPLYNLHKLAAHPDRTVIVVEGEKTADALAALIEPFGKSIVTTWIGGANGINNTDWTPLSGRKVLLWPDNDWSHRYGEKHATPNALKPFEEQPGNKAMLDIAGLFKPSLLRFVSNPDGMPCGWDIADAEWTADQTRRHILENSGDQLRIVADYLQLQQQDAAQQLPPEPPMLPEPPFEEPPTYDLPPLDDEPSTPTADNIYFRFLGYINDGGRPLHCFYANGSKIIVKFNTSQMTVSSCMDLAPLNFWEQMFPKKSSKTKFDIDAATNWLSQTSQGKGIFSPKMIRGRGAWDDDGRTVVHSGSHLVVDGQQLRLGDHKTRFIYEIGEPLGFGAANPMQAAEASKLVELLKLLNWERDINSYLLAGWCVVAPICGALKWRPHIWITGGAGTGKSWLFKEIVRRLLGETGLAVQGETSEAGLRQSLGHDALPVVFDEAEAEDKRSQERIQTVLTLMRAASADDGGVMAKGSAGGNAVTYRIRSCFAFASIGVSLSQQSDRSRVTILGLKKLRDEDPIRIERWKKLTAMYNELITDDYVQRLQARTLTMVPIIIANAQTFANAAAAVIGAQRTGDQLGALLAGAYSLFSGKRISYEEAVKWVSDKDWSEERGLESTRDEAVLFAHLMEQLTRVETGAGVMERQIGELLQLAGGIAYDSIITEDIAHSRLKRLGFKVDNGYIIVSNSSDQLLKMLSNTPWKKNHHRILLRIEGAKEYGSTKFSSGLQTRAVGVPLSLLQNK